MIVIFNSDHIKWLKHIGLYRCLKTMGALRAIPFAETSKGCSFTFNNADITNNKENKK